jgi:hypothetical protein
MGEREAAVARVIRLRHARHVGLVIRGDTIVVDETQRSICQQYTSSVVLQVALAAPTLTGNILGVKLSLIDESAGLPRAHSAVKLEVDWSHM